MQTIKSLISEKRGALKAERTIRMEDRIEEVYLQYPMLKKVDVELLEVRKSIILDIMDDNNEPVLCLTKREEELLEERRRIISENKIDEDFDSEKALCDECKDTGFTVTNGGRRIVCVKCMSHELNKCYELCGMREYEQYTLKTYKHDYFGSKDRRKDVFESVKRVFETAAEGNHGILLYSDKIQSGKTFLSVILAKYAIIEGVGAVFTRADDILSLDSDDIEFIKNCEFLIVDEYAAEVTADWRKASVINAVLEARNAIKVPTLMVSSSSPEELIANSDARISAKLSKAKVL